jgi:hypothetical protein
MREDGVTGHDRQQAKAERGSRNSFGMEPWMDREGFRRLGVFLFANRRRLSGGCVDSHTKAWISPSIRNQKLSLHAPRSMPPDPSMPDAETALLLYDRYFSGFTRPVSDLAGFLPRDAGSRAR